MRKLTCALLVLCLLTGCVSTTSENKQYTATFLTLFDTVTTIVGRATSQEEFTATAQAIHDDLLEYHRLFDIYNNYDGLNNLKTVNDQAGIAPVVVDGHILDLLEDCKNYYILTRGRVNVAMGSVLNLWHTARNDGIQNPADAHLPDADALAVAGTHSDLDCVVLDREQSTVFLSDPEMRLDVGAIAKGWSAQRVCENAPSGLLISVGGNVCATGAKDASGTPWIVGIQDPAGGDAYLHTLAVTKGSVVTSGDYQRTYTVDGKSYHHIIDPDTLYPGVLWRSVTVVCPDSGLADALSTALFLLPLDDGLDLLDDLDAEAMWLDDAGTISYSSGFEPLIRT